MAPEISHDDEAWITAQLSRMADRAVAPAGPFDPSAVQSHMHGEAGHPGRSRRVLVVALAVSMALLVGLGIELARHQGTGRAEIGTVDQPSAPEVTEPSGSPTPSWPPALRPLVRQDLIDLAACMRANGVADFPEPPPSLGDGRTPTPAQTDSGPAAQAALSGPCLSLAQTVNRDVLRANGAPDPTRSSSGG